VTEVKSSGWRGKPPSQAPTMYAAGNTVVTTNGASQATISFGRTFPAPPVVVPVGGNRESVTIAFDTGVITTTGFTATFYDQPGNGIANAAVRCLWIALPAT
jgi:hypothetical protein